VEDVVSGCSGGDQATARYEVVRTGRTGHTESIRVVYDPSRISYGTLLKVFFSAAHDPTELNYQGPDPRYAISLGDFLRRRGAAAHRKGAPAAVGRTLKTVAGIQSRRQWL
jgi:hypothetical protein